MAVTTPPATVTVGTAPIPGPIVPSGLMGPSTTETSGEAETLAATDDGRSRHGSQAGSGSRAQRCRRGRLSEGEPAIDAEAFLRLRPQPIIRAFDRIALVVRKTALDSGVEGVNGRLGTGTYALERALRVVPRPSRDLFGLEPRQAQ